MLIVGFADIHGRSRYLENVAADLASASVVLLAGDITNFGGRMEAAAVINDIKRYCPRVLGVGGNCDGPGVEEFLDEIQGNLNGRWILVDGVAFLGASGALLGGGQTPNERPEEEFGEILEQAVSQLPLGTPMVLVTHQPAWQTGMDRTVSGEHAGSRAIRDFIIRHRPLLCISGHMHDAVGVDAIGGSKLVNPGPLFKGGYVYAEVAEGVRVLELRQAG